MVATWVRGKRVSVVWRASLAVSRGTARASSQRATSRASPPSLSSPRLPAGEVSSLGKTNLSEYLTEELRVLPHHFEVEAFVSDLEKTRDDVERLSARINLLVKGLAK